MTVTRIQTLVILAALALNPLTAEAKSPFKGSGGSFSQHAARRVSTGISRSTSKMSGISHKSVKTPKWASPKITPKLGNKLVKHIKPHPIVKPLPKPLPKPFPKPFPKPLPKPFPKPLPYPVPHPIPHPHPIPCPKPYPVPCPRPVPCPGPIVWPVPRPCPLPVPCPTPIVCPVPEPCPQPYPVPCPEPVVVSPEPVEPADAELPEIAAGQRMNLPLEGLGEATGSIVVKIGPLSLPSRVEKWEAQGIIFVAPEVDLAEATRATLYVLLADGSTYTELPFNFVPGSAAEAPADALAAQR